MTIIRKKDNRNSSQKALSWGMLKHDTSPAWRMIRIFLLLLFFFGCQRQASNQIGEAMKASQKKKDAALRGHLELYFSLWKRPHCRKNKFLGSNPSHWELRSTTLGISPLRSRMWGFDNWMKNKLLAQATTLPSPQS